jgi:serine/threonine protein kinase
VKICPSCGESFEAELRFCPRDGTALRSSETSEISAGATIAGRYAVIRELGKGGMGVVYLANHIQMDRPCALKVLRSALLASPDTVARFHREARSASRISHPNVVAVHDFGESGDGTTYLAMEFVDGRSLDSLLDEVGTLTPRRAARITWQIANGLTVAHDLKIVHRDLKPANIMLTRYRAWEDFVKVVDFGIAKAFGAAAGATLNAVTTTGELVGTPMFMSPEQWTDSNVDHRSDVFALTMITVRMLTTKVPSIRSIALTSGRQLIDMIPDAKAWPEDVKEVLSRGLDPDPDRRYASAGEFATAFIQCATKWEPAAHGVREPWEKRVGEEPTGKRPVSRMLALAAGIAGVGAVVLVAMALSKGDPASPPAPTPPPSSVQTVSDSTPIPNRSDGRPQGPGRTAATPSPAPAPPTSVPAAVPPATRTLTLIDTLVMLQNTLDVDNPNADSAQRVVRIASGLLRGTLPDSARIEVSYRLASAQLLLGADAEACRVLREVRPTAEARAYLVRSVSALLDRRC